MASRKKKIITHFAYIYATYDMILEKANLAKLCLQGIY